MSEHNSSTGSLPLTLLVGRPNAGKTSVFNRLTGHRLKTGNYHGVTVEHAEGVLSLPKSATRLIDLPGTPSLIPTSPDEGLTVDALLNDALGSYQAVMVVVDATRLLEGLYLALQVIELGRPTLIIVNQIDLATRAGIEVDVEHIQRDLTAQAQVPVQVLEASARTGLGFAEIPEALESLLMNPPHHTSSGASETLRVSDSEESGVSRPEWPWGSCSAALWVSDHPEAIERAREQLKVDPEGLRLNAYLAWLSLAATETEAPLDPKLRLIALSALNSASGPALQEGAEELIKSRFHWLDDRASHWVRQPEDRHQVSSLSDQIDRWVLHPVWGTLIFLSVMLGLFQALFVGSDPFIKMIESGVQWLGAQAQASLPSGILREFIVEGLINGVGNVIVFLPQVLILFGLIGLMEDSGYMARAAALTDRVMRAAGLSGRAFVPMLSGFICAVPAILATRTLPQRRDRLLTMMSLPLLTCSARLPVYTLLIATLLPEERSLLGVDQRAWVMISLYLFAIFTAFAAVWVMGRTILKGETPPLLLHLPTYRRPVPRDVLQRLFSRAWVFIKEAGTVILMGTIVLWLLLNFPRDHQDIEVSAQVESVSISQGASELVVVEGEVTSPAPTSPIINSEADRVARQRAQSYGGQLGRLLEPALKPLGWDWQVGVGLIGAFAAREVFISTLGMVYGVEVQDGEEINEESASLRDRIKRARHPNGDPVFTPISALALLIFFSLACQCMSTLAAVKRETGGYRWPLFMFGYMSALAYGCALLVTWVGKLIA